MLLSSLRVLTERISARQMEPPNQDAVLHVIHLLTRFPPAVRAVQILMSGKSPRPSERAALAQALYEVLKEVVPIQLIKSDPGRYFEGTRLLLGLILEKAKHLKLQATDCKFSRCPVFCLQTFRKSTRNISHSLSKSPVLRQQLTCRLLSATICLDYECTRSAEYLHDGTHRSPSPDAIGPRRGRIL